MKVSLFTSSRTRTLIWLMLLIGVVFISRLFYLQIIQHSYYEAEGLKEHLTKFTIPAQRGFIYAKDGSKPVPLVLNEPSYTVYADPRYVADEDKTAGVLRRIAGGNTQDNFEDLLKDKQLQYAVLAKQLSQKQADLLRKEELPGIGLQEHARRVYPEGQLAAQLLGYVNTEDKGQYGIEQALEDQLAGKPGLLKTVTDVRGIPLSLSNGDVQVPAQDGKDILLGIDRNIQAYAEQALQAGLDRAKAKRGSLIVMDPNNGEVMAMANFPTYDPAKYYDVKDYAVFQNAIVSDPYEAGSVMKTFTMSAGLNEGAIKRDSTFQNTGSTQVDDIVVKNVLQNVNGTRNMEQVLEYSLNTGVVHILRQLGGGEISAKARHSLFDYFSNHYFFGKPTGIEQSSEAAGKLYGPTEEQGNNVRYATMAFGQGMNVTMMQVASAYSAMINGGTYYKPRLVAGHVKDDNAIEKQAAQVVRTEVVKPTVSQEIREMMHEARTRSLPKGIDKGGYYVGGKTGTSQIIDPKTGKYIDSNAIGSYLGYGGNETPRYVIMVRVVDAQIGGFSGSVAAAPIFADMSNWLLDYLKVQPMR